jgi:hypothetical protein
MPFKAQMTRQQVAYNEIVILKYIVSYIQDIRNVPTPPYFLTYGIIDWAWPLRFVRNNEPCRGYLYYSHRAYEQIANGVRREFRRDHIFPKKLLRNMLFRLSDPTIDIVRGIMEKYGEVCVITKDEHAFLKDAGLSESMPTGWTNAFDIFSRYQTAGISTIKNKEQW